MRSRGPSSIPSNCTVLSKISTTTPRGRSPSTCSTGSSAVASVMLLWLNASLTCEKVVCASSTPKRSHRRRVSSVHWDSPPRRRRGAYDAEHTAGLPLFQECNLEKLEVLGARRG